VAGALIADIPFPTGSAVMLIVRADELIAPSGSTILQAHDHVFVFCKPEDRATIELLFGAVDD
jgi:cell volume regulation protein A